jgi:dUTP pyrophosphatase
MTGLTMRKTKINLLNGIGAWLKLRKLDHFIDKPEHVPSYASLGATGLDIRAMAKVVDGNLDLSDETTMAPMERAMYCTGLAMNAVTTQRGNDRCGLSPDVQIRARSGLAAKHGIMVLNAPGTVDLDYTGPIRIVLLNTSTEPFKVQRTMRIAQMVIGVSLRPAFIEFVDVEATSERSGGFGSTGTT